MRRSGGRRRDGDVIEGGDRRGSAASASRLRLLVAVLAASAACLTLPEPAAAQGRWFVGGGLTLAVPRGEFEGFVDEGLGFGGHVAYTFDRAGVAGLRLDASVVTYGSERFRVPLSTTVSRVRVDVTTRNNILLFGAGPQLALPAGPFRPYVNGQVGLGYFYTESSVRGSSRYFFDDFGRDGFAQTTNFDDLSFAYGAGGGLGVALSRGGTPVFLTLDAQYRNHGRTRYLREGGIEEGADGRLFLRPLESDADVLILQLGVTVGL